MGPSENQSFLDEGVISGRRGLGVLGGQMTRLHDDTIFFGGGGCNTLKGVPGAVKKKLHFSAHLQCLNSFGCAEHCNPVFIKNFKRTKLNW